jgi:cytochrome c2
MRKIALMALSRTSAGQARRRTAHRDPRLAGLTLALLLAAALAGCDGGDPFVAGNPERGKALIVSNGCPACHIIPGVSGADGLVGPPLTHMERRIYIAGLRRNTPENMEAWLENPQAIVPGNVMPNMGLTKSDAQDITAYLYQLR